MQATNEPFIHPYIPNSSPATESEMLKELGIERTEDLYDIIPKELRFTERLDLPEPILSETKLKKHFKHILSKNISCNDYLNFLGAGCYQHEVPALCDEIIHRQEFLTAYCGETLTDKGKYQAVFEYTSMLGELLGMDVVSCPTYDWAAAASSAILMAARITGRKNALVISNTHPERLSHMNNFCRKAVTITTINYDKATGNIDMEDLKSKLSDQTACIYFENPNFLGAMEEKSKEISRLAHDVGAVSIVGVDPLSLGIFAAPSEYDADIVVGDMQPMGNHMACGSGLGGFIASRDEDIYCNEYPTYLYSIRPTKDGTDFGFDQCTHERTSYVRRDESPDYIGTSKWLSAIACSVYLALLGPTGIKELGETIISRNYYAKQSINKLPGVKAPFLSGATFQEFIVNFDETGKTVSEINKALLKKEIFGGLDLSQIYPELGQSALFCITEVHDKTEIDRLVSALKEVLE